MALVCKQKCFLVYTLSFASQIEFSNCDRRDLNIISRTKAVIHQYIAYLIFFRSSDFSKSSQERLSSRALCQPVHSFSSEDNLVGLMMMSLIKRHGVFPARISNCPHPHCPRTSTEQWLSKIQNSSSWNKLWAHERTQMAIS